jgi:hypothetical protein
LIASLMLVKSAAARANTSELVFTYDMSFPLSCGGADPSVPHTPMTASSSVHRRVAAALWELLVLNVLGTQSLLTPSPWRALPRPRPLGLGRQRLSEHPDGVGVGLLCFATIVRLGARRKSSSLPAESLCGKPQFIARVAAFLRLGLIPLPGLRLVWVFLGLRSTLLASRDQCCWPFIADMAQKRSGRSRSRRDTIA